MNERIELEPVLSECTCDDLDVCDSCQYEAAESEAIDNSVDQSRDEARGAY